LVVGAVVATLPPERRTAARTGVYLVALAAAAILLGPAIWVAFDLGLGTGPVSAALLGLFAILALPLVSAAGPRPAGTVRSGKLLALASALLLLSTAALTAGGLAANREGATDARQEQIKYSVDADTGDAYWTSGAVPASDWSRSLLSRPAGPLDDAFPWRAGSALRHGPAPAADLPAPAVIVLGDITRGDTRELTLRISSRRDAPTLGLWVDGTTATVVSATVGGRDLPTGRSKAKWDFGFRFYGAPEDGVEVRLRLDQHADGVTVRVADSTDDLGVVPGFVPPPEGRVLVTPEVVATRAVTL
jgi:hypothetical protein